MSEQVPSLTPGGQAVLARGDTAFPGDTPDPDGPNPPFAREARGALRVLALVAVGIGLAALAAAAFVLSYAGIHAVALQAGISHRLAKGYPLMLDVLLVVIVAAVLALRTAGWPSKLLAWASLLALLAAAAGADALHAAGKRLPARPAAVTAAILPWALVLIAFVLMLAMLRHARLRRVAQTARKSAKWQPQEPPPPSTQPLVPGFAALAAPGQAPDDPGDDEAVVTAHDTLDVEAPAHPESEPEPEQADADDADPVGEDSEMPVFHRMWSAPVPPEGS